MRCETPDIVVIWRGAPEALPPLIDLARRLSISGLRILLLCGTVSEGARAILNSAGVQAHDVGVSSSGYENLACKASRAILFRARAWRAITRLRAIPLLWVINAETAIVLGSRLLSYDYVLHTYELPETLFKRWLLWRYVVGAVSVITPDRNRSAILRAWYRLPRSPSNVPNTCYIPTRMERQEIRDSTVAEQLHQAARGKRIALYQGMISPDRDLTGIARGFAHRYDSWQLVLMGHDYGHLSSVREANPATIHIPHLNTPDHLPVTSWASIGILVYNHDSLNSLYCAPSKLSEYSAFGLPMLANDVPGLKDLFERTPVGVCCDALSETDTLRALNEIELRYPVLRAGALDFHQRQTTDTTAVTVANLVLRCHYERRAPRN